jgi:hypothetical protein
MQVAGGCFWTQKKRGVRPDGDLCFLSPDGSGDSVKLRLALYFSSATLLRAF